MNIVGEYGIEEMRRGAYQKIKHYFLYIILQNISSAFSLRERERVVEDQSCSMSQWTPVASALFLKALHQQEGVMSVGREPWRSAALP